MQKAAGGKGGIKAGAALASILKMDSVLSLDVIKGGFDALDKQGAMSVSASGAGSAAIDAHEGDPEAAEIDALVRERTDAKKNRDFARADQIRDELTARGIVVTDTPDGPVWERKK
jgi:cysteinyl-tRNA synthetase